MSAPPHAKWLMEGVPMPEYMRQNCPKHYKHRFSFLLGRQGKTKEKIAVYESYCTGNFCKSKVSDTWPEAARTELHYLLDTYLQLTKRMDAAKGTPDHAAAKREMRALVERRDAFSGKTWGDHKRSAAESEADDVDGPSTKKPKTYGAPSAPNAQENGEPKAGNVSQASVQHKGKAKRVDVATEYDEFEPKSYVLDPSENLTIDAIIYDVPHSHPFRKTLELRHGGGVNLASFDFSAKVRGIRTTAGPALDYDWFCVFAKDFLPGAFSTTINMLPRGRFLVCRSSTMLETECPGLQDWINKTYESLVGLAKAYGAGDEDDEEDVSWEIPPSSPPPTSQSSAGGPSGSSQSLPSVNRASGSASSSMEEANDRFRGMSYEPEFWKRQDEEDRKMAVLPGRTKKANKGRISSEVIVIDD